MTIRTDIPEPMTPAQFRSMRRELGLTQNELAAALRMGRHGWQTISKWESDKFEGTIPGPATIAMECLLHHRKG